MAGLLLMLLPLACQSIAGIEERRLGPCGEYCEAAMEACTGENAVYSSLDTCLGVCSLLPEGDPLEPLGSNSVACRLAEVRLAAAGEPDVHCPRAGPAGGGSCGGDEGACESYCELYQAACGEEWYTFAEQEDCIDACLALRDTGGFDVAEDFTGDSLQCRLVHVSAATVDPDTHCEHAQLAPPTAPCVNPPTEDPSCEAYCRIVQTACFEQNAQYEDEEQCLSVCTHFDVGTNSDIDVNTLGCRTYHAYNALLDPDSHCPHAGPTGDGHCGSASEIENSPCDTYCSIVAQTCALEYAAAFAETSCESSCVALPDATANSSYTVADGDAGGDTLACRMLEAARATQDASLCAAAAAGLSCQ